MQVICVYSAVFLLGFVVMGFEMIAGRIMTPVFGGGIDTWAAIISTMLLALTTGYFGGSALPGRFKTPRGVSTLVIAASFYLAVVPLINGDVLRRLSLAMGDGLGALLLTSLLLCFVPVMLLGMFSPCSVFLVAAWGRPEQEGVIAGRLYGVSTLGSVAGTLGVTFALIPRMGSANLTLLLAGIAFLAGTSLWVMGRGERGN